MQMHTFDFAHMQAARAIYRTRAIISRGLYIFYNIFHCGLYCRAVTITINLYTEQGNSSIFEPKIHMLSL